MESSIGGWLDEAEPPPFPQKTPISGDKSIDRDSGSPDRLLLRCVCGREQLLYRGLSLFNLYTSMDC